MNRQQLYIIGNGFDLHHGLRSSYMDFKCYLCRNYNQTFDILRFLINDVNLWTDFENALGRFDENQLKKMLDSYYKQISKPKELCKYYSNQNAIDTIHSHITCGFIEWINSFKINSLHRKVHLDIDAMYLCFNYTNTLEELYGISPKNICYIHGKSGKDGLVFGHNKEINVLFRVNSDDNEKTVFYELLNFFKKDCIEVMNNNNNKEFFDSLSNYVSEVFVLGHSINNIDLPYFQTIKNRVSPTAKWLVSYYGDNSQLERSDIELKTMQLEKCGICYKDIRFCRLGEL